MTQTAPHGGTLTESRKQRKRERHRGAVQVNNVSTRPQRDRDDAPS